MPFTKMQFVMNIVSLCMMVMYVSMCVFKYYECGGMYL